MSKGLEEKVNEMNGNNPSENKNNNETVIKRIDSIN